MRLGSGGRQARGAQASAKDGSRRQALQAQRGAATRTLLGAGCNEGGGGVRGAVRALISPGGSLPVRIVPFSAWSG